MKIYQLLIKAKDDDFRHVVESSKQEYGNNFSLVREQIDSLLSREVKIEVIKNQDKSGLIHQFDGNLLESRFQNVEVKQARQILREEEAIINSLNNFNDANYYLKLDVTAEELNKLNSFAESYEL